jgi:4-hydroxy-tetrahydrodipicolinate synthase
MKLQGALTALVTPFKDGKLDVEAYRRHVRWQIEQGIDGLVPCGTTGEAVTMTAEEQDACVRICVEEAKGRIPVVAGAGSNATRATLENVRRVKAAGADAALVVTPYYNKPSPEGLYRHFRAVAEEGGLPVVLYNVPGRTGVDMQAETVARLAEVPGIVGLKEACGQAQRVLDLRERIGDKLTILSGDDALTLPMMACGARGVISVASNVVPADAHALCAAAAAGKMEDAQRLALKMNPLARALFIESNPVPAKAALALMGRMSPEVRPPLAPLTDASLSKLVAALVAYGLVSGTGARA